MDYEEIKLFRERYIHKQKDYQSLNTFHDRLTWQTINTAIQKVEEEQGKSPAPFAFFVMGSAGRCEQSVWTDQDHGIVYRGGSDEKDYFLELGEEIAAGLEVIGYPRCEGKVMASEPMWTHSTDNWINQVEKWLEEATWQSLRHFSTFFDSRVVIGESSLLDEIKRSTFNFLDNNPEVYRRLIDNVSFLRKGIGIFGQLLPEQSGPMTGSIHLKTTTFFPYVNSLRLLALMDHHLRASTVDRFIYLKENYPFLIEYEDQFKRLLEFRYEHTRLARNYEEVHYVSLAKLSKSDKQELKQFMKSGAELFEKTKSLIEKECLSW
ncbi:CBS domain-containing protein [Gracilibacillus ureilyticus]|uniref:CBS domain-containing protein n=1 Tax=Gracilibacillus ureilyticus TaxID=531814 RepID=A0A1H9NKX4_9BACI|nr:DUF294 nucleotidyltransferase-like domain-containing protein [Gracilibacillus ureilyticus]SER36043.1 CBS domain-containing protein [Gracilibacillus ureilyticus]